MPTYVDSPIVLSTELITPELAYQYLKTTVQNRPVDWGKVAIYAQKMREGLWQPFSRYIEFTEAGDLINGQHRLLAIIESGLPQTLVVVRGLSVSAR